MASHHPSSLLKRGLIVVPALLGWDVIAAPREKEEILKLVPTKE